MAGGPFDFSIPGPFNFSIPPDKRRSRSRSRSISSISSSRSRSRSRNRPSDNRSFNHHPTFRSSNEYYSENVSDLYNDLDKATDWAIERLNLQPQLAFINSIRENDAIASLYAWTGSSSKEFLAYLLNKDASGSEGGIFYKLGYGMGERNKPNKMAADMDLRYKKYINEINRLFHDIPPTTVDIYVYRGMADDFWNIYNDARIGSIIENKVYTPTTMQYYTANRYTTAFKEKTGESAPLPNSKGIIRIIIPAGSHILPLLDWFKFSPVNAMFGTEYEILLHYNGSLTKISNEGHLDVTPTFRYNDPRHIPIFTDEELKKSHNKMGGANRKTKPWKYKKHLHKKSKRYNHPKNIFP